MAGRGAWDSVLMPIHRAGWPFIAGFFVLSIVLGFIAGPLFWVGLVATAWCAFFFRDPERVTPTDPTIVVSPADGLIHRVGPRIPPPELGLGTAPLPCVSVFLNVFDVPCEPDTRPRPPGELGLPSGQVPQCRARQGLG